MLQSLCCMEQDKPRAGIDGASPVCPKPVLVIFKVYRGIYGAAAGGSMTIDL